MSKRQLRVGLIGAGHIGETHSIMLSQIASCWPDQLVLTAVADRDRARRERLQSYYGYRRTFDSSEDLIQSGEVDAVFVCTPTRFHAEAVRRAAAHGLHVFCEKPLAMSYEEAKELLTVVRRAGVSAQIGLVLRFSAVYNVMRDLLRREEAGKPMAVWFRDDQCFPIRGIHDSPWRKDREMTAGGTLIEHGVHDLDLLVWMFGSVARLRAWEQNHAGYEGVEDYVAVEIEFESGLRGQLLNLWHDMVERPSNRRFEVFCRRAFFASDHDMTGPIDCQWGDSALVRMETSEVLARYEQLAENRDPAFREWLAMPYFVQDLSFVEAILSGISPEPGFEVGVEAQRLADAVYMAARTGSEVDVRVHGLK